ncbi:hypothetical protein [Rhizobium multihospitium]|uniref:Uncharacterized protein n=1 Tax=Rhizobium multihospitium TaxID=410764 RepID=A0A1C3WNT9_9HYPH|nr:hypothetical protein [Rhizobium multihospitium]SCB41723.1 hypothetical protein GA0061103_5910 [Rhizobium multihospitium]
MNSQATKNLRQALPDAEHGSLDNLAAKAAAKWASTPNTAIDGILDELDLLDVAQRALVTGETLEEIGASGPYGTTAQRRAWAAGKLSAAAYAIVLSVKLLARQRADMAKIAELERRLSHAAAEIRAAKRYGGIIVPFRERRKPAIDWDAAA